MTLEELRAQVAAMKGGAADQVRAYGRALGVSEADVDAVVRALGEISVDEALDALERIASPQAQLAAHRARHVTLHRALDELFADYIAHHPRERGFLARPIQDLIAWSYGQTVHPDPEPGEELITWAHPQTQHVIATMTVQERRETLRRWLPEPVLQEWIDAGVIQLAGSRVPPPEKEVMRPDRDATCAWDCQLAEGHAGACSHVPPPDERRAFTAGWQAALNNERAGDDEDIADAPDIAFSDYERRLRNDPDPDPDR